MTRWLTITLWTACALVAVLATVDLLTRQARDREELHRASVDAYLAALYAKSFGEMGQVNVEVIRECGDFQRKLDRYSHIPFVDHQQLDDFRLCPDALRAAARFYESVGGEYGCRQAGRALDALDGKNDQDMTALKTHCPISTPR